MSFTAQVKDELSRVDDGCPECAYAQLSAIMRVCGTLSLGGGGRYSVRVATETGAVARTMIRLTHNLFDLETPLTVRRSNLHKARNYLIEMPPQDELEADLERLGILVPDEETGRLALAQGIPHQILENDCCRRAFLRGAFMAGGFIADPRGDFHLEIAVSGERFANDLVDLFACYGVRARLNRRRGNFAIYIKSFDDTVRLLSAMGSVRCARAVENVRRMKSYKNDVNRRVNAEIANQSRSADAAVDQMALVRRAEKNPGLRSLPRALREFCVLRSANPELSLAALGELCNPPASKSAMYHRFLRLQALLEKEVSQDETTA